MKNIILALLVSISAQAFAKVEIEYRKGESARSTAEWLGITPELYHKVVEAKLNQLQANKKCGLTSNEKLMLVTAATSPDDAQEEITYHYIYADFEKVALMISLSEIQGASKPYNPVMSLKYKCN